MLEDRLISDLNHGLRLQMTLLTDSRTESAGKNYNLHKTLRAAPCSLFLFFERDIDDLISFVTDRIDRGSVYFFVLFGIPVYVAHKSFR